MKLKCKSSTNHALFHQSRQRHSPQQPRSICAQFFCLCRTLAVLSFICTSSFLFVSCTSNPATTTVAGDTPTGISSDVSQQTSADSNSGISSTSNVAGTSYASGTSDSSTTSNASGTSDASGSTNGAVKTNPDWKGYKGYTYAPSYVHRYSDERNRKWEDIVLELANSFLHPATGHVYLLDQEKTHLFIEADMVSTSILRNAFDKKRYQYFVTSVEDIISRIDTMRDIEIGQALVALVNGLSESHTNSSLLFTRSHHFGFKILMDNDIPKVYCTGAHNDDASLLGTELIAINGLRIENILEKLRPYAWGYDDFSRDLYSNRYLRNWDLLEMLGIVEGEIATFTFMIEDGLEKSVQSSSISYDDLSAYYQSNQFSLLYPETGFLMDSSEKQIWFKHLEDDTIYIRINSFWDLSDTDPDVLALIKYLSETKQSRKLVLDLRGNPGGHFFSQRSLFVALRDFGAPQKYILVDPVTNSASIVMSYILRNYTGDTFRIVGTKCWNTNFARKTTTHKISLPGDGELTYNIADASYYLNDEGGLLQPDVELYWEYEDYINGLDTYLEWVKQQ